MYYSSVHSRALCAPPPLPHPFAPTRTLRNSRNAKISQNPKLRNPNFFPKPHLSHRILLQNQPQVPHQPRHQFRDEIISIRGQLALSYHIALQGSLLQLLHSQFFLTRVTIPTNALKTELHFANSCNGKWHYSTNLLGDRGYRIDEHRQKMCESKWKK